MGYDGLALARDVYAKVPKDGAEDRKSGLPITSVPVTHTARTEDLYIRADHWVGMRSSLTTCTCRCHLADGSGLVCGKDPGRPDPDWCGSDARA